MPPVRTPSNSTAVTEEIRLPAAAGPRLRDDRFGRLVLGVVAVVTTLSAIRALLPMPWLGDIWRPADTATIARNFYRGGMNLFFPQINWGGNGPGYVEAELQLVPWLAAAGYHLVGEHAWVGRMISVVFTIVAVLAFWGLVRRILPPTPARWALLAFVVSPAVMTWGNAFMPDITVLAFYVLALLGFQRWLSEDRGVWLAATAGAVAVAALVKPTSLHVGLVLLIWLLLADRRRFRGPMLYVAAVAAVVPVAVWLWHASNLYRTYGNTFGVISGGDSKFGNLALWTSPLFWTGNATIETMLVFGVAGVPFAVLGAWTAWRARGPVVLAAGIPAVAVFYVAVARYSMELGPQYHVFSLPFAAIVVGLGVTAAGQWLRRHEVRRGYRGLLAVVAVVALSVASITVFAQSFVDRRGVLAGCAQVLQSKSAPTDLVIVATSSVAVDRGTSNNFEEPTVFYLADRKGWSLPADRHDPALVASYLAAGARWFVEPDPSLLPPGAPLTRWLAENAQQVRSVMVGGCDMWSLRTRT
ncbi:ArnT family glycosyltransferase [Pseudonocardia sp. GCM10023141]|uniref:ArnT family glycosyltransferase n=1 Tax=Pseudonocardia sp. GCM10023141 TaxID=3252653 RepID=UPI00361B6D75